MSKYLATFYIGETDGDDNFEISEKTKFVQENWKEKAKARLNFGDFVIHGSYMEENEAFDDDDQTYLLYLDCEFEIDDVQKELLESAFEADLPSTDLFSLECGNFSFTCGVIEELE